MTQDTYKHIRASVPSPALRAAAILVLAAVCCVAPRAGAARGTAPRDACRHDSVGVRIARRGIIIAQADSLVRAMEPFGGSAASGKAYAGVVNSYKRALGDSVAVYCMPIPTAVEFYCPAAAAGNTRPERPVMDSLLAGLAPGVVAVDVYGVLKEHSSERIYSRTDHHWAPLGAYYAAREFAARAGTPFAPLSGYERRVVSRYVGSMYTFSRDPAVKASPEEFVYYVPRGVDYEATATVYRLGRGRRVVGEQGPEPSDFFVSYPDGARDAYCTFMGGDLRTVRVATSTRNGRRLMILKDSYGNALPGYLFHSFEEIHVVDFRYFTRSIRQYVSEHRITDVLFANNMMHACLPGTHRAYAGMLAR